MSVAAAMPSTPVNDPANAWRENTLGINTKTGGWFIAAEYRHMTVAGVTMDVLLGRSLTQGSGTRSVAKNARELALLRPVHAQEAHDAFVNAFAALNTRRRYKTLRSVEYKALIEELRIGMSAPDPVSLVKGWRRAAYYLNQTRSGTSEGRGGSFELQTLTADLLSMFTALMAATYGESAAYSITQEMQTTFALTPTGKNKTTKAVDKTNGENEDETPQTEEDKSTTDAPAAKAFTFRLTANDVIIGIDKPVPAPEQALHIIPTDIPPADGPPVEADLAAARDALPGNAMMEAAATTMNRAEFLSLVNMLKDPIKRVNTMDLSEILGINLEDTRRYLQNARALIEDANPKPAPRTPYTLAPARSHTPSRPAVAKPAPAKPAPAKPSPVARRDPNAVVESLDMNGFIIDRYDRAHRTCMVRGTNYMLQRQVFNVLKAIKDRPDQYIPYQDLRSVISEKKSARTMVSKAMTIIDDLYAQSFVPETARQTIRRYSRHVWFVMDVPAPANGPKTEKPARTPRMRAEKIVPAPVAPVESIDLGRIAIDRYDRRQKAYIVHGTNYSISGNTFMVLKALVDAARAGTYYVSTADLRAALGTASSSVILSKALSDIRYLFAQDFIQPPVGPVLVRPDRNGVVALMPQAVSTIAPIKPTLHQTFDAAALPAHFDAGDFTVDYVADRPAPARINGGDTGISPTQYGILIDLFNQRGTVVPSADIGAKYYPTHIKPKSTALASISRLRDAFKRAGLANADSLIETAPGGHIFRAADTAVTEMPESPAAQAALDLMKLRAKNPRAPKPPKVKAAPEPAIMPDLFFHPVYGPGLSLGPVTREIAGETITLERFQPLTLKENGDEVFMSEKQMRAGFGRLDMDAYRGAMEAGARELRASIDGKTYDGPPLSAVEKIMQAVHSPADRIALLASFAFHIPLKGSSTSTNALRTQLERSVVRGMVLAYPFVSAKQAHKHLQILQNTMQPIPEQMVWPFESAEHFAKTTLALDAWQATLRKGQQVQLGEFQRAAMGKARKSSGADHYDVRAYLAQRGNLARPALVAN